jgi:hypothetical protein
MVFYQNLKSHEGFHGSLYGFIFNLIASHKRVERTAFRKLYFLYDAAKNICEDI